MKNKLNGSAKWVGAAFSIMGVATAAAYKYGSAVQRMDTIEDKHIADVADIRGDIKTVTEGQAVMRDEQIRQGRILERVAAKVGADPH